jgi:4-hydroxy-3-polyprenylbenzoate decarboxylase
MAYKDLQDFIKHLDEKGLLKRINAEVDSELEITEITDRISKKFGPALLFENLKGSSYPVLINAMGSYERMSMALGVERLDDIGNDIEMTSDIKELVSKRWSEYDVE